MIFPSIAENQENMVERFYENVVFHAVSDTRLNSGQNAKPHVLFTPQLRIMYYVRSAVDMRSPSIHSKQKL